MAPGIALYKNVGSFLITHNIDGCYRNRNVFYRKPHGLVHPELTPPKTFVCRCMMCHHKQVQCKRFIAKAQMALELCGRTIHGRKVGLVTDARGDIVETALSHDHAPHACSRWFRSRRAHNLSFLLQIAVKTNAESSLECKLIIFAATLLRNLLQERID